MMYLNQLTEQDWDKMTSDITNISTIDEDVIHTNVGNALNDLGYDVSDSDTDEIITPKINLTSPQEAMDYAADTEPLSADDANSKGKRFWHRIKDKLKPMICQKTDSDSGVKDTVKTLLPVILTALGFATVGPLIMALLTGVAALLIKMGLKTFCGN
ncbi:MAG TPA: hypothetical protein VKG26_12675 [Bacteroidia bacterium]|nr:hypothetical protein [Bacteroidia bacterium]